MAAQRQRARHQSSSSQINRKNRQPSSENTTTQNEAALSSPELLQLQRSIGNRATTALMSDHNASGSTVQPSLQRRTQQVLALQRAAGNQATARLLTQSGGTNTIHRWPWKKKTTSNTTTSAATPDATLELFDKMREDPALAQQTAQNQSQQNQGGSSSSQSGNSNASQNPPPPARKYLASITPNPKALEDPDHHNMIEGLSLTSTTTDAIGSMLSNAGGTTQSGLYDSVYQSFLREQGLPSNTDASSLTDDQASALEEKQVEEGGLRTLTKDSDIRTDLNIASSAMGVGISGLTSLAGFLGFVDTLKQLRKNTDPKKRTELIMELVNQGTIGAIGGLQTATSLGGTITSAVSKYQPDNDAASAASNSFSGLGDLFGSLGGLVEMFVTGIKAMKGAFALFKGIGEGTKREQGMQIASDFIKSGKAFLMTGKSVISGAKTFMDVAGKANTFTSAVPIIGAAINIVVQLIDTGLQVIDGVREAIKIAKARRVAAEMQKKHDEEEAKGNGKDPEKLAYLKKMVEINIKRVKRAVIPLVTSITNSFANVLSIAGSILNIVGAATSAAYGAGVAIMATGYAATGTSALMKLGGAAAKPIAAGVRTIKQKGRDMAEKTPTGVAAKVFKFNAGKSTNKKNAEYVKNAQRIFDMITSLPDKFDANNAQEKQQYEDVYTMLKATGIDTKELFSLNGEPKQQMLKIIEAMQIRE